MVLMQWLLSPVRVPRMMYRHVPTFHVLTALWLLANIGDGGLFIVPACQLGYALVVASQRVSHP